MLQPGQVSEGALFNNPQTVDIPHRSAGIKGETQREISTNDTHARRSLARQPPCSDWRSFGPDSFDPGEMAKRCAAARMSSCFCGEGGTCRVPEVRASLTSEPGCAATGRRASGSARCSRSGRSRCGTKRQQVNAWISAHHQ